MEREFEYKRKEIRCRNEEADIYNFQFSSYRNSTESAFIFKSFKINHYDLILEIGCGTGRFTVEFAKKGAEVVALDYSADSLKISKSRCKCHVVLADLCSLPFKDSVFDKAASISVFQHVPTMRSRIAGLREIRRVLKEEAKFLITVYNSRLWDKIKEEKQGFHEGLIYYYRFDISELKQMLLSAFSKIVDIHYIILEENCVLSPTFRFLYGIGLARSRAYISFLALLGKTPLFRLFGDHILSLCKS